MTFDSAFLVTVARASAASASGDTIVVHAADTLSAIANRCDVSKAFLLNANPAIQGSSDLHIGERLHVDSGGDTQQEGTTAVCTLSCRATHAVERLAGDLGSSVRDLLDKNPDLNERVDTLGSKVASSRAELQEPPASTRKRGLQDRF